MGVREITLDKLPRATRNRVSPIKNTPDWIETVAAIRENRFEVLEVEFSPETMALGKVAPLRFKLMLEAEIKAMGRGDLKVMFRGWSKTGARILYVVRRVIKDDGPLVLRSPGDGMTRIKTRLTKPRADASPVRKVREPNADRKGAIANEKGAP
jgi:hypothetical protein